jgi:GTP-binding protein
MAVFVVDGREDSSPATGRSRRGCVRQGGRSCSQSTRSTTSARDASAEFYQLGFEPVVDVSAEHGTGTGDLLDHVIEILDRRTSGKPSARMLIDAQSAEQTERRGETTIAIVSRPNVGKSSLLNALLQRGGRSSATCLGRRATPSMRR